MKRAQLRSTGVDQTLAAPAREAPSEADLAFEELYRSSRDDVHAYAAGLLRDRFSAEEVTATAFERAFRKHHRFDPSRGSARAWLFGIARNAALDELRRRRRQTALAADPADASACQEEIAGHGERRAVVLAALAGLEPRDRELLSLRYGADLTARQIGELLGLKTNAVEVALHRALGRLRAELLTEAAA
jgi:RNA polymerase sigma-70 factor (ECF subfamily)